jgi:hypothetical protein
MHSALGYRSPPSEFEAQLAQPALLKIAPMNVSLRRMAEDDGERRKAALMEPIQAACLLRVIAAAVAIQPD